MVADADATPGGSKGARNTLRLIGVAVVIVVIVLGAVVYVVLSTPKASPNTPPHDLSITISPASGNNTTAFTFQAHATDDQDSAATLQVRWNWQANNRWDTPWSTNKNATHTFTVPGQYAIKMEVMDSGGLTANATLLLTVDAKDYPPHIYGIDMSPTAGDTKTTFTFTANVTDDLDPVTSIQVRWDWQADGIWDRNWTTLKVAQHLFPVPGNYTVLLEAQDSAGLVSRATRLVDVARAPTPPPLKIGTILSLTGALGVYGGPEQNGVTMAVEEINANGGVLGQPIQLYNMDDGTNPATAASAAQTLVHTDNVSAIIGTTGSGMCAAVLPVAVSNDVFEVAPSCTSPSFSNLSLTQGWFARTAPSDALQAVVAASFAYSNMSWRKISVMALDNAYGRGTAAAFANEFTRLGGQVPVQEFVPFSATTYTTYLQALFASGSPDAVYCIVYPPEGVQIMEDWWANRAAWPTNWTFSEGVYDQTSFINPLVTYGVNVSAFLGTAPAPYAGIQPPAYAAWAARYQTRFGSPPTLFAANAYDAAYLVAFAAQAAGNTTGWGIRLHLQAVADPGGTVIGPNGWAAGIQELALGRDIDYNGASGSVDVGPHGDVPGAYVIWGVNATNQLVTREFFNETFVVGISPPGTYTVSASPTAIGWAAVWRPERPS